MIRTQTIMTLLSLLITGSLCAQENPTEPAKKPALFGDFPLEVHGFYELRSGYRLQDDAHEKDMSVMEGRFQLDLLSMFDSGEIKFKTDVLGDGVEEQGDLDLREMNVFLRPTGSMDVRVGRQPLTWGTGDLLFINDLFPKDWQSFFIGRDVEYLKAPSDAAKVSLFNKWGNLDVVYTPQFDNDRFISGERLSYWHGDLGRLAGSDNQIRTDKPNNWFSEDELAVRLYRNIKNYELAFYGYWGFWKSPAGASSAGRYTFPPLNVYGASVRGTVGKGIGNAEIGYYDSRDDTQGTDPMVDNSQLRYLLGYTREIGKDLTAGLQYYVEQMLDYHPYKHTLAGGLAKDEYRQVMSLRLTKLLNNQNLRLSWFHYYSPSDDDVYARPNIHYKVTDRLAVDGGANIFFGENSHTFFGQFQKNTNIYAGMRYSF